MEKNQAYVLPFSKMQGLGNDFVMIDAAKLSEAASGRELLKNWTEIAPTLAKQLCNRQFGIGADGLILAFNLKLKELKDLAHEIYGRTSSDCEVAWIYTNSDGSPSNMCANGLRCLALWAYSENLIAGKSLKVLTGVGELEIGYQSEDLIEVDLGEPKFLAHQIPFLAEKKNEPVIKQKFLLGEKNLVITCVNVGNPHCVIFQNSDLKMSQITDLAEEIQSDKHFPEGVNVSFVQNFDRDKAQIIVFERGCGPTLACGSAACAVGIAGVLEEKLERSSKIRLPGGELTINWSKEDNHVRLMGPARFSFKGEVTINQDVVLT